MLPHAPRDVSALARADGAQVDPDLVLGEASEHPVSARGDLLEDVVVGKRAEHDLRRLGKLARCVAPLQPLALELTRALTVTGLAEDGVARGEEPGGHVATHVPEPDDPERGHRSSQLTHNPSVSVFRLTSFGHGRRTDAHAR